MPAGRTNKFARARQHLRSTHLDEKIQMLSEIPTNNTTSYYQIEPDVFETIPAVLAPLDLTADDAALLGKDTSGLFDEAGNSLAESPPGDNSYILGPMVSVYFPDGDYTAIGYIQKDTRKVINLARIPGTISGWGIDGNVEGFTSYSQLTVEQALWYRDKLINGDTSPYRVFYVGVFEQLDSEPGVSDPSTGVDIDEFGRWTGDIVDSGYEIEPEQTNLVQPGKSGPDPDMPPGIANPDYSQIQRGDLFNLSLNFLTKYANPFTDPTKPLTEDDLSPEEMELIRRNVQQLLDFPGAENPGLTQNGEPIKTEIQPSPEQIAAYNIGPDETVYQLNPYILRDDDYDGYQTSSIHGNDLETFLGTTTVIVDKNGNLTQVIDDYDFAYGAERGDGGLPGTPIDPDAIVFGSEGPGYVDNPKDLGSNQNPLTNPGRLGVTALASLGIESGTPGGSPFPVNIDFSNNRSVNKLGNPPSSDPSVNPNLAGRALRSVTDPIRYSGDLMFQGNPAGRSPGLSNYWSPDPATAATYSNPGDAKGIPGTKPNPTGTLTTAQRPPGTPRVSRGVTGTPQFKFPKGTPPPDKMLTKMADDAAVSAGKKAAARTAGKTLAKVVPVLSIGVSLADAGARASRGDYAGALLSGMSAVPGPIGWAGLGMQIITDTTGFTGVKEQKNYSSYDDYINDARKIVKDNKIKIDRNATLSVMLDEISKNKDLSEKDKAFMVAIFTGAEGLKSDDVISFIEKIQKKLSKAKVSESHKIIFSHLKKPYELKEVKTEKIKHRPNINRWSTRSVGDGLMKKAEVPTSFKRIEDNMWKKQDRRLNRRFSQERKNMILDTVGTSDHAWEYITDRSASGNEAKMYENFGQGIKNQIIEKKKIGNDYIIKMYNEEGKVETVTQSVLNERLQKQYELVEQETIHAPKDPLVARIKNKLYSQIDYENKPSKFGYPNQPPPQMYKGYHPDFGDRHAYYNRLDRHSADTMQNSPTNNLKIDQKVDAQTTIAKIKSALEFRKKSYVYKQMKKNK